VIRRGWRLVPLPQEIAAFDGEGARRYGGRWNSAGVPMVYASEHESLAVLEVRVHIAMSGVYKSFSFDFDEGLMRTLPVQQLPKDWQREPPPVSLQRLGDQWVKAGTPIFPRLISTQPPTSHWIGASFTDPGWVSRRRETAPRSSRKDPGAKRPCAGSLSGLRRFGPAGVSRRGPCLCG